MLRLLMPRVLEQWTDLKRPRGSRRLEDSHDHAYAERAMVKTAERAETTQAPRSLTVSMDGRTCFGG